MECTDKTRLFGHMTALLVAVILAALALMVMSQYAYAAGGEEVVSPEEAPEYNAEKGDIEDYGVELEFLAEATWSGATPELQTISTLPGQGITVTWGKVALSSGYQVYRKTTGGWIKVAVIKGASTVFYIDTDVEGGMRYTYTVRAYKTTQTNRSGYDATGLSLIYSQTGIDWNGATPELQSISALPGSGIAVTWGQVKYSSGYQVYRKTTGGWVKVGVAKGAGTTSYYDTNVVSGETYKYTIRAWKTSEANRSGYDAKGLTITYSNAATSWTGELPQLKSVANVEAGVKLTWSKVNYSSGYQIWRRTYNETLATYSDWVVVGTVSGASIVTYTDKKVNNGEVYQYTVCSFKSYVTNRGKKDTNGIKIRYLAAPQLVSLENRPKGPVIEWLPVEGATGYIVYRKTASSWQRLAVIESYTKLRYLDAGASQGATVAYTVVATKNNTTVPNSERSGYSAAGLSVVVNKGVAPATYTIQPTSEPCDLDFVLRFSSYNEKTRHYYLLRSYFERFEEEGGGVLVLEAGTYTITNTLFIPSNTTVKLSDGVTLVKSDDTGSDFKSGNSIFQLCAPSVGKASDTYDKGKYPNGYTKYNGVHDVTIIGSGKATIDHRGLAGQTPIVIAHTEGVTISGITFQNVVSSHFIELDASKNAVIKNCIFKNATKIGSSYLEAINLDTPDLNTGGFNAKWSSFDCTANNDVTIEGCTFDSVVRAIGTHRYSYGWQHTNIKVINNIMTNIENYAIVAMNWKDVTIQGNTIEHLTRGGSIAGILGQGTVNITVTNNVFNDMERVAQFCSWQGSGYDIINPSISAANKQSFTTGGNAYTNIGLAQINITTGWDNANNAPNWNNPERIPIVVNNG